MTGNLLAQTQLVLSAHKVAIVGLDTAARQDVANLAHREEIISLVFLPGEVTMIVTETLWQEISTNFPAAKVERGFRLLTLDITLPWNVVGYLARVCAVLAEGNISVGVISSHSSDHLLIREAQLAEALSALTKLGMTFKAGENGK